MPVGKIFAQIATVIASISVVIALAGFLRVLFAGHAPNQLIHELENWAVSIGYYVVLMLLATTGMWYLTNKK